DLVSSRSPQLVSLRKAEVSTPGSLVSHRHHPLHITSFLSLSMLTCPPRGRQCEVRRKNKLPANVPARQARPSRIHSGEGATTALSLSEERRRTPTLRDGCSGEVGARVDCLSVHDRHEVAVRTGRPAGHADVADDRAGRDELPDPDRWPAAVVEVAVERREVVAVRDDHDDGGIAVRHVRATDGDDLTR